MRRSATVAAGVGVAAALPASSWSRIDGANDDIRVAVVGLGGRGRAHVGKFQGMNGVRVVATCDPDRKRMREGPGDTYTDYRKLLEDKSIDVVVTASCNHWHAPVTVWGCEAGKDVYVEKPISHTLWEGQQMIKAARENNRIVQAGTQQRSNAALKEAIQWLQEGHLGKVVLSRGLCYENRGSMGRPSKPLEIPDHIDYDLWCGPAPKKPLMRSRLHFEWHWMWDTGNGDLGNQGAHQIDVARMALGQDKLPTSVVSVGGRFRWNDVGDCPNTQLIFFDYKPAPLLFEVTQMPNDPYKAAGRIKCGNVVHCEGGYYVTGEQGGGRAYDNKGREVKAFDGGRWGDVHQENFIKAVRSRKPEDLNADVAVGHASAALCHMGTISHWLGKRAPRDEIQKEMKKYQDMPKAFEGVLEHLKRNGVDIAREQATLGSCLTFDPENERFTGPRAAEANRLMTKKYRKGFVIADAETLSKDDDERI
jgi:predicted dehydrogenase